MLHAASLPLSRRRALWLAARPTTLWATLVPVFVGSALAHSQGSFRWYMALVIVFCALLIQIGTNLFNDYADFRRGADTHERVGPLRATQQGWLPPRAVLITALCCFAASIAMGGYIVSDAGWPFVVVGLSSIAAGVAYTAGPWPLAYVGLGEPFTFVFFGPVAVVGTYYLHTKMLHPAAYWASAPIGFLVTAILVVNNLRDRVTDGKAKKHTSAVRFGSRFARREYALLVLMAAVAPLVGVLGFGLKLGWLLPLLALPVAIRDISRVGRAEGRALNPLLGATARLELLYGILLAIGMHL